MTTLINRIKQLDQLITTKHTGTPSELANSIGLSERSIYEYIKIMKAFGAPIKYSRAGQTYLYETAGSFKIMFIQEKATA